MCAHVLVWLLSAAFRVCVCVIILLSSGAFRMCDCACKRVFLCS